MSEKKMGNVEQVCPVCKGCGYNDRSCGFAGWATECSVCKGTGKIKVPPRKTQDD